jgi:hypothetical protein
MLRQARGTGVRRRHFIALTGTVMLAGCSSNLNPFNWFGGGEEVVMEGTSVVVLDPRPLVQQVTRLEVDTHPAGAIVRATGLPPRQGYYDAELIRVLDHPPGVLTFQLRAFAPHYQTQVSTQQSRELVVATFVGHDLLDGIREIRVSSATNTLSARR